MNTTKKTDILHWISLTLIATGLAVAIGWILDIQWLKSVFPGYVSMKINTSIGFILSGIAFFLLLKKNYGFVYQLIAIVLIVFGLATMLQDFLNYDLGIDQFLISDLDAIKTGAIHPGRPSPMTALCFSLTGLTFLLFNTRNSVLKNINLYPIYGVSIISFIAIAGYLFNVPSLYKISYFSSMAIHTSLTFFIMSIGIAFVPEEKGFTELFIGDKIGNLMARKLFPRMIIAILILGFLRISLHRYKIVSEEFGIALFTTGFILIATSLILSTAKMLNKIDFKRKEAEIKIRFANTNLEKKIRDRTHHLAQQNRKLEDFANIISHNLRGPVGNLGSLLHFYKEEETPEGKEELIDKFEKTVDNIEGTLNDLLEIISIRHHSKNEREKLVFETVFSKILQTFEGEIMKTKAEIITDFSKAPEIEYTAIYLESIMQNLLSNALKYYSPERTPIIRFETYTTNDGVVLEASDNGLGIDLERHGSKIFGMNKVFHNHPEAKGVGLFITKAQIEGMGGNITINSQVNKGTTFTIIFNSTSENSKENQL